MDSNNSSNRKKHPRDEGHSEERIKKHKKHHSNHEDRSKSHKERDSLQMTGSQKIANLLKALDEALDEDGLETTSILLGDETLNRCLDLQKSLRPQNASNDIKPIPTKPASQPKPPDGPNIPKSMTPVSITPWHSTNLPNKLPALPAVLDATLEEASFSHTNTGTGAITDITYERLEWVGDAYLELVATLLIAQTFPHLTPGKMSQLRERCIKNLTLADFAISYGFDKRARLGKQLILKDEHAMTKIHGDMFEAYVAAIVLSDPENGVERAAQWLKVLWGQKLRKEIVQEEMRGKEFMLSNPMWKLVGDARDAVKQKPPLNPKDQLQKALGSKGVKIEYRDISETKDRTNKLPLFTVGVYLHGWGESGKQLGRGSANGKKDAGMKAAEEALRDKKVMAGYIEKKRIFDEQMELEKQALQQAKSS